MCISLTTALLIGAIAASGTTAALGVQQGINQRGYAEYEANVTQLQSEQDQKILQLQASEQESIRAREFREVRARSLALMGGSNFENRSYLEGVMSEEDKLFGRDISAIRLNAMVGQNRLSDRIAVARSSAIVTKANASLSQFGAIAGFAGDIASAGAFNRQVKTPPKLPGTN